MSELTLNQSYVSPLLEELPTWGKTTTIVIHLGSVFEFKGHFPSGSYSHGYFNLSSGGEGFEGHIRTSNIASVGFQDKPHRGVQSLALLFNDKNGDNVFKVFVGREENGELIQTQVLRFRQLQELASQYAPPIQEPS
ncbi:heme utilization cystosolic carrier protein HutX [Echinimonas agarilytica]|uniref:Heme utilization cystosolic carrier protein HutX n=1 Tax=Echinimonas agarilytica TaxID=1215918 RepID=A0AA41W6D7_9GAMM|nr:heme utilization cystosolic carrier protein HutX [Echinimonas agarilytica]MCM2679596.1 heme utilization cystosolic carrier protein HutX [Echinimonas agarilytica]